MDRWDLSGWCEQADISGPEPCYSKSHGTFTHRPRRVPLPRVVGRCSEVSQVRSTLHTVALASVWCVPCGVNSKTRKRIYGEPMPHGGMSPTFCGCSLPRFPKVLTLLFAGAMQAL